MKTFFKKWISGNTDEVSSKRVTALVALVLVIFMGMAHTLGGDINAEIYIATITLVAAALGLTLWKKI